MSERRAPAWLVRHGGTQWSGLGRHTGRTDIPLTDRGRREAGLLAARLGAQRFVRVFTSPLWRAADTGRLAGFGEVAEPRDDLMEWDYGAYEGRTTPEIRAERPGWLLALGTTAISVLGYERELPVIINWNEDCHLPGEAVVAQSAIRHGRGR